MSGISSIAMGEGQVAPRTRISTTSSPQSWLFRIVKRSFDIVFSTAVLVVGFVPGLVLSLFVMADTKGSPLYTQERIGVGGKPFKIYKFRTMVADADNVEKYLNPEQLATWHAEHKVDNDPRITPLGHFLRKSSIDEFPQFINVLFGTMSTIGPRAITAEELRWFGDDVDELLSIRPGITGIWQTGPRNEVTFESGARQMVELSYVRSATLSTDIKVFFGTFKTLASGTGK